MLAEILAATLPHEFVLAVGGTAVFFGSIAYHLMEVRSQAAGALTAPPMRPYLHAAAPIV